MAIDDQSNPCHCINLRDASRRITKLYDDALAETGLKVTQYSLLAKINRLKNPSLQALAVDTNLDRSTLGRNIRVLQKGGFVQISEDENDKRLSRIELTDTGWETLNKARHLWIACQQRIEKAMGSELHNQLNDMIATLARLEPDEAAERVTDK